MAPRAAVTIKTFIFRSYRRKKVKVILERAKGYRQLTDAQKSQLQQFHRSHMSAMGLEARQRYEHHIKAVKCIKPGLYTITYSNGDWWHYDRNGWW